MQSWTSSLTEMVSLVLCSHQGTLKWRGRVPNEDENDCL